MGGVRGIGTFSPPAPPFLRTSGTRGESTPLPAMEFPDESSLPFGPATHWGPTQWVALPASWTGSEAKAGQALREAGRGVTPGSEAALWLGRAARVALGAFGPQVLWSQRLVGTLEAFGVHVLQQEGEGAPDPCALRHASGNSRASAADVLALRCTLLRVLGECVSGKRRAEWSRLADASQDAFQQRFQLATAAWRSRALVAAAADFDLLTASQREEVLALCTRAALAPWQAALLIEAELRVRPLSAGALGGLEALARGRVHPDRRAGVLRSLAGTLGLRPWPQGEGSGLAPIEAATA